MLPVDNRVRLVPLAVWEMVDSVLMFAQLASPADRAANLSDLRRQFAEGEVVETDDWCVTKIGGPSVESK